MMPSLLARLQDLDPDGHGRIKGLRLVAAYGIAAMLGGVHALATLRLPPATLAFLAGAYALWASVSEARATPGASCRDLAVLCATSGLGALLYIGVGPSLARLMPAGAEFALVLGAFLVGFLKRFGVLGAGMGSQVYIGEILAYSFNFDRTDLVSVGVAVSIAIPSAIIPRLLAGRFEYTGTVGALSPADIPNRWPLAPETIMGIQAAIAAVIAIAINQAFGLAESVWAVTAAAYVVASTASGTVERVRRRIVGTLVGVPLGLICLPLATHAPVLLWSAGALAMVLYGIALPKRYDIACGAFAFTLVVTLAASGQHSIELLAARTWQTILGGTLGLAAALWILPLRERRGGLSRGQ
ncbi:FUSC family protein [Bordetella genomosp. 11]|uniref:LysR family transcriptional regulator n=1 Tax=Bordetella genomosp. 11 TaxID=1416808 RepID=A0A261UYH9_9BORD|nr:FUSC family protein [Bordetella genomosp. 11]OZI66946.1 LysR family transcriptional regulator [Bordetella genomosp. 11]